MPAQRFRNVNNPDNNQEQPWDTGEGILRPRAQTSPSESSPHPPSFPGAVPEWKPPPWLVLRLLSVEGGKPLWLVSLSPPDNPFSSPSAPFIGAGLLWALLVGPHEGEPMIQVHGSSSPQQGTVPPLPPHPR